MLIGTNLKRAFRINAWFVDATALLAKAVKQLFCMLIPDMECRLSVGLACLP